MTFIENVNNHQVWINTTQDASIQSRAFEIAKTLSENFTKCQNFLSNFGSLYFSVQDFLVQVSNIKVVVCYVIFNLAPRAWKLEVWWWSYGGRKWAWKSDLELEIHQCSHRFWIKIRIWGGNVVSKMVLIHSCVQWIIAWSFGLHHFGKKTNGLSIGFWK